MDNLKYLEHVVELGKVQAATTPEEMSGAFDAFNGFLGLYYDLASCKRPGSTRRLFETSPLTRRLSASTPAWTALISPSPR